MGCALGGRPLLSRIAIEHHGGVALVCRARRLAETRLGGDAERRRILRRDDAGEAGLAEMPLAPTERGADGLGGVALALRGFGEGPAHLRDVVHRGDDLAAHVEEAGLADACAAR